MSWPIAILSEQTDTITKGTTPTSLGYAFTDAGVPFIRVQNIEDGSVNFEKDALFVSEETHHALRRSKIYPNDVLISIAGTIGRAGIVPPHFTEMNCNQAVAIIRPKETIDRRYLLNWLNSEDAINQIRRNKVTATIPNLSLGQIGALKIPLPPLPEQRRIAGILDQADALRRLRRQSLARLSDLGQSIFYEMFGDVIANDRQLPVCRLNEFVRGFDTGKNLASDPDNENAKHRVLKISAVTSGQFDPLEAKPLPNSYQPPANHFVTKGDLLFSRANTAALIGATAIVDQCVDNLVLPDKLWRFQWHGEAEAAFTHHLFQSQAMRGEISRRASGTSGSMKNIGKEKLLSIKLGLPSNDQRDVFRQRIEKGQTTIDAVQKALFEADSLFASLQHRAFRGEL